MNRRRVGFAATSGSGTGVSVGAPAAGACSPAARSTLLDQAAEREVEEETGVRATAERYLGAVTYTVNRERYELHLFGLKSAAMTATWDDHRGVDAFLVPIDQARQRLSFEDYRAALHRAAHHIR